MRAGVVVLAVAGMLGAAAELATARHWLLPVQFVPWVGLGVLAVALLLLAMARGRPGPITAARVLAVLVMLASAFGVYEHVVSNYARGAGGQFSGTWEQLPEATKWWYAVSESVGIAPPLAPGVLGYVAALTLLATVGLGRRTTARVQEEGTTISGD